jgi:hypothetical protein
MFDSKNKNKRFCSIKCQNKAMWESPGYREKMCVKNKEVHNSPEMIEKKLKQWQDPIFKEKMILIQKEVRNRPIVKENFRRKITEFAQKDENRKKMSEFQTKYQNNEDVKEKNRLRCVEMWKNSDYRERLSQIHRDRWCNTEWVANYYSSHGKYYEYELPSGKIVKIQGYEPAALNELLKQYTEDDIMIGVKEINKEIGRIKYIQDDIEHSYYPDFYIKSTNTIIEVKSTWTYEKWKEKNELKKQACIDKGLNFKFMFI